MPVRKVRCIHCNKERIDHKGNTFNCPIGSKHRTVGYAQFHKERTFSPKPWRISVTALTMLTEWDLRNYLCSHSHKGAQVLPKTKLVATAVEVHADYAARSKPL